MDPPRQADALLSWYLNTAPHRTATRANVRACKHLASGRPWSKSGVFSSGCGAAVRMPPIGLLLFRQPESLMRAAQDNCIITHNEPRAKAASVAVAYLTARLLQSTPRCSPGDQVLETADFIAHIDQDIAAMLRWVTQIVHLNPEEALFEIGTSSDAIEAIPAAVYCFLKHPRQYAAAVLIAANGGDAADSIAALTGSFVGASAGIEAIPKHWLEEVENGDILRGVGENLAAIVLEQPEASAAAIP
jgi:ADP-ribosylglycohydrolase